MRVLVVEPNAHDRSRLGSLLRDAGYEATLVADGAEALVETAAARPDFVISECLTPRLDGFALCRELRRRRDTASITFVFYTESGDDIAEVFARRLGADAFIAKSDGPERLLAHMRHVVARDATGEWAGADLVAESAEAVFLHEHVRCLFHLLERKAQTLERENAELAARDAHLRGVIEGAPECVKLFAPDGTLLEINPAGLRLFEADSLEQARRRKIDAFVAEEDRTAFRALIEQVLRGRPGDLKFRAVGLKGGCRWLETHATPRHDAAGHVVAIVAVTRDITASKQATDALRETEARLRLALQAGHLGIWEWNVTSDEVAWSPRHAELLGMAPETSSGTYEQLSERVHPEDREALNRAVRQALEQRRPYHHEYRLLGPDGAVRWVAGRGEPFFDDAGRPVRMISTVTDVTEARRTEQALRESGSFNEQIIRGAREGILVVDRELRYVVWNPFLERLTGITAAEVIGRKLFEVFPQLSATRADAALRRALEGEPVRAAPPLMIFPRTGGRCWVAVEFAPLYSAAGEIIGVVGTLHDVTERRQAEEALRENQRMVENLLGNLPGMVYRCRNNEDWTMEFVSDGSVALTGYSPSELIGDGRFTYAGLIHPEDRDSVRDEVLTALAARRPYQLIYRIRTRSGEEKWVWEQGRDVTGASGSASFLQGFVTDVTEQRRTEDKVRRLNRVYAMLSGINALIVRVNDRDELFREATRVAVEAGQFEVAWIGAVDRTQMRIQPVAWSGEERGMLRAIESCLSLAPRADGEQTLVGQAVTEQRLVVINDAASDARVALKEALTARNIRSLTMLPLITGDEVFAVLMLLAREPGFFDNAEVRLLAQLATDIAFALDHIDKEERLSYLAHYDPVTGLANRALFHERLEQFVHAAERDRRGLALCLLDLDHFKYINDSLGRETGDTLLAQFGQRLAQCTTDAAQVARLGADRFALILPEATDEGDVVHAVDHMESRVTRPPFRLAGTELRISMKIGIARFPTDGGDADTLFRNSEAALKKTKTGGDRLLFYTAQMTDRIAEKLTLENKLRRALEKGEFEVHYQPKVDTETRAIAGVEALIRWRDPEEGLVLPIKFVPLLEESGFIAETGAWVMQQAVRDYDYWIAQGVAAPRIAVNVSAMQLRRRDFIDTVRRALGPRRIPVPIELEITESVLMENIEENIELINALHAEGISISIDDFGTGYSSLGYLARLPTQALKIDLSFVSRMLTDRDVLTLVSTMISLAHSMRLRVVAEGVETEQQADVLRRLKCDELQGYLISPPLPRERVADLLRSVE